MAAVARDVDQRSWTPHPGFGGSQPARRPDDRRRQNAVVAGPRSLVIEAVDISGEVTRESLAGRFLLAYERQLVKHLGKPPSVIQRLLIQRMARIALHFEMMDKAVFSEGKPMPLEDFDVYFRWNTGFMKMMENLGFGKRDERPRPEDQVALKDYLAELSTGVARDPNRRAPSEARFGPRKGAPNAGRPRGSRDKRPRRRPVSVAPTL